LNQQPIANLHDIVLPDAISYIPQTAGWYVLGMLFFSLLLFLTYRIFRHHQANLYRKTALLELSSIERTIMNPETRADGLNSLPVLVKRVALAGFSRPQIASLSGASWLAFLDETGGISGFSGPAGQVLLAAAYSSSSELEKTPMSSIEGLVGLIRLWIRKHKALQNSSTINKRVTNE
jgi:hypothetical protein